jgi:hypothetical protein
MIEIQPSDLQVNQTYYIDMRNPLLSPHNPKIKAIFKKFVSENGSLPGYAVFYKYTQLNSSDVDYWYGECRFMNYRSYKYYLPTRNALVEKWEKDTVNIVLQNIMGDPCFTYV